MFSQLGLGGRQMLGIEHSSLSGTNKNLIYYQFDLSFASEFYPSMQSSKLGILSHF
jgi:hypothetical protein